MRHVDEVYVHADRHGELLFGGGGQHRLAIFQHFSVHEIPVQLGVVHLANIDDGFRSIQQRRPGRTADETEDQLLDRK